jgi:hypothetical protein
VNASLRPTTHLFVAMGLLLVAVAVLSHSVTRGGDLPATDYFVFPFVRHTHGAAPEFFPPGVWTLNFLGTSYLVSVILNAIRPGATPIAWNASPLFFYIWVPFTAIAEVAGDTLVPLLTTSLGWPFQPLAFAVCGILFLGVAAAHACARGSAGEW